MLSGYLFRSSAFGFRSVFGLRISDLLLSVRLLAACVLAALAPVAFAASWQVRVEEPTGLYPRTNEVVVVPFSKLGTQEAAYQIVDPQGQELPWQTTESALLFPATLIPGELPMYRVAATTSAKTNFINQIHLRKLGINRLELGNRFFRV